MAYTLTVRPLSAPGAMGFPKSIAEIGGGMADGKSPLKLIREFFGMSMAEMKAEWVPLPEKDKAQLVQGLTDGTLTY